MVGFCVACHCATPRTPPHTYAGLHARTHTHPIIWLPLRTLPPVASLRPTPIPPRFPNTTFGYGSLLHTLRCCRLVLPPPRPGRLPFPSQVGWLPRLFGLLVPDRCGLCYCRICYGLPHTAGLVRIGLPHLTPTPPTHCVVLRILHTPHAFTAVGLAWRCPPHYPHPHARTHRAPATFLLRSGAAHFPLPPPHSAWFLPARQKTRVRTRTAIYRCVYRRLIPVVLDFRPRYTATHRACGIARSAAHTLPST